MVFTVELLLGMKFYYLVYCLYRDRPSNFYCISNPAVLCLSKLVSRGRFLNAKLNLASVKFLAIHTDTSTEDITWRDGANTRRRSSKDDVARVQRHDARDVAQDARDAVDHQARRALLLGLAVDRQEELNVMGIGNGGLGYDVAHGQEGIEALGNVPGKALLLGLVLDVAGSHVDGDGVGWTEFSLAKRRLDRDAVGQRTSNSVNCALLVIRLQVLDSLANDERKLDLVVQRHALGT